MTSKEKRLFALGAGAGLLLAGVLIGLVFVRERASHAAPLAAMDSKAAVSGAPAPGGPPQEGTEPGTTVELSPAEVTAAGVQVADVRTAILKTSIDAFGRVEQPEAQLAAISARIGGRVDKLYVQYTGEHVEHGQPVADLYSPEVATAVAEHRLAQETRNRLRSSPDTEARSQADALVDASKRKLELWGVTGSQADAPETSAIPHVTLHANATGTVVERKVTQGQYVNAGDTLFTVADLSQVWIKADVYEEQLQGIRPGQPVEITAEALHGRTLHGRVDFVEPSANPQTRTVPVHVHVANPGMRLVPGMFVSASFQSSAARPSIVVPRSAVLDSGTRKIVYVAKPNGVFVASEVQVGAPSEDLFPVISGLAPGDRVVLNGNFLIDSQAHLSAGMSGLYGGSKEFNVAQQQATAAETPPRDKPNQAARIDLQSDPNPLKAGEKCQFQASLLGADGKPIPEAKVTITLLMPAMPSMGMPEMKKSFDLQWDAAQHLYIAAGQAPMAGPWNTTVEARKDGAVIATFRGRLIAR